MNITQSQQASLDLALMVILSVAPALGPNGVAVAAILNGAAQALKNASATGADVTDAELQALFDQFEVNKADDAAAQAEAKAKAK